MDSIDRFFPQIGATCRNPKLPANRPGSAYAPAAPANRCIPSASAPLRLCGECLHIPFDRLDFGQCHPLSCQLMHGNPLVEHIFQRAVSGRIAASTLVRHAATRDDHQLVGLQCK